MGLAPAHYAHASAHYDHAPAHYAHAHYGKRKPSTLIGLNFETFLGINFSYVIWFTESCDAQESLDERIF